MPLSRDENPAYFRGALESVFSQTVLPDELLLVCDGPVPDDIDAVIATFRREYPDTVVQMSQGDSSGLGSALRTGVEHCSYDLVARMDSDDIAVHDRFERQLEAMTADPQMDLLGGYTAEFHDDPDDIQAIGKAPTDPDAIASRARHRNPINHPTVMFRRTAVLAAGNYTPALGMEDYDLWVRMLLNGSILGNLPTVLVRYRVDGGYANRGGLDVVRQELRLQRRFLAGGFIGLPTFLRNVSTRVPFRMLPAPVRDELIARYVRERV